MAPALLSRAAGRVLEVGYAVGVGLLVPLIDQLVARRAGGRPSRTRATTAGPASAGGPEDAAGRP